MRDSYVLCSSPLISFYAVAHVVKPECTEDYLKEAYDMTATCLNTNCAGPSVL